MRSKKERKFFQKLWDDNNVVLVLEEQKASEKGVLVRSNFLGKRQMVLPATTRRYNK